jgi:DNA-binding MarR family transcriptional regulator
MTATSAGEPVSGEPVSRWQRADESTGLLLWQVTLAWQRAMRAALDPHELTHVQFVLLASAWWLGEHEPGLPTQQRIAHHAGTDSMMTSQVLRKLADRRLIVRDADDSDARVRRVRLTPAGRTLLTGALADVEAADVAFFGALGGDSSAFLRGLAALRDRTLGASHHTDRPVRTD